MAYGVLYTLTWESLFGESETLEIRDRDLDSDSDTTFILQGNPISIEYDTPNDFAFHPVNGSRAQLRLVTESNFQFRDLYTSDAIKYKVVFKIGADTKWVGFLMPRYQGKYTAAPYPITFMASDRLGMLKDYDWDKLMASMSELQALGYILEKTDLKINMQEGLNIYEDNHNDTAADSPLDQTYFNGKVFEGKTYYDALYHILFKYLATLRQQDGEWFIHRPGESGYLYDLRKWTLSGNIFTYDSVQSYNPMIATTVANVDFDNLVRIADGAGFHTRPGWKNYVLKQDLGLRDNIIKNYDFTQWTGNDPDEWFPASSPNYARNGDKLKLYTTPSGSSFYQETALRNTSANQIIRINIKYEIRVSITHYANAKFGIKLGSKWHNPDTQTWDSSPSFIYREYDNAGGSYTLEQGDSIEITTDWISDTPLTIYLFSPISSSLSSFIRIDEVECRILNKISSDEIKEFDEEIDFSDTVDVSNFYKPPDMEILLGDIPVSFSPNADIIWFGTLFRDAGKLNDTYTWNADGRSGTLGFLMTAIFDDFFQDSQQVVSGPIYTKLLRPCDVIVETNDNNRAYMIKRATWHPKLNRWDVEMYELPFDISLGSSGAPESPGEDFLLLESASGALLLESASGGLEKE